VGWGLVGDFTGATVLLEAALEAVEEPMSGPLDRRCGSAVKSLGAGDGSGERLVGGKEGKRQVGRWGMVMALAAGPATVDTTA
jgi:hypothetical protein